MQILKKGLLQRLFSTFATGLPGAGLLLMRLVVGAALVIRGVMELFANAPAASRIVEVVAIAVGVMLIAGFWTPVAASFVGIVALWNALSHSGDLWACIFLTTMGAALALLGPGGWSLDARLFGWRRIEVRDRRR